MPKLAQERTAFIDLLHEVFVMKKGHGAYAYVSVADAMILFDKFLASGEPAKSFIKHYVHSV